MNRRVEGKDALLRRRLRERRWARETADKRGLLYRGPADFVLQHGTLFEPARPRPAAGAARACFGNSIALAETRGLRYVEGYAVDPGLLRAVIHHAWNLTPEGELCDVTWGNRGLAYLGVEFSLGRADDATWNGDASVLDDSNRGWPLFRERWRGEDFERQWEPSELLVALRSGDPQKVRDVMYAARLEAAKRAV